MVGNFDLSHTPDIHFGIGSREKLTGCVKKFGERVALLTGKASFTRNSAGKELIDSLVQGSSAVEHFSISSEPTPFIIDEIVGQLKTKGIDCVIGIGGGSVIDAGKAVSAMLTVEGSVKDYLEGVGKYEHPGTKVPFIAMPTTAGTGSEATKNAVITELGAMGFKKSLRHDNFVPNVAIVDPELMRNCPPQITAAGGMDAFTQLLESYLSTKANTFTDSIAMRGMERLIPAIETAVYNGHDLQAREAMAYASLLSGIALANAGLGVVHGFAQPMGSLFPIPHGVVCGTLMAAANKVTLQKILNTGTKKATLSKYATVGTLLTRRNGVINDLAELFIQYLEELTDKLALPKLSAFKVKEDDFDSIVAVTGIKNHPIELEKDELKRILKLRL